MNPRIRIASPEETQEFHRLHSALLPTPGFVRLGVGMSLALGRTHHELVSYGGVHTSPEALPVMRRLHEKIGRNGTVAYRHIGKERAAMERYLKQRERDLAADRARYDQIANEILAIPDPAEREIMLKALLAEAKAEAPHVLLDY